MARPQDTIPVLAYHLAHAHTPVDLPWRDLDPHDLFALALDSTAAVAEALATTDAPKTVIGQIGVTVSYFTMLADTIRVHGRVDSRVHADVRELAEWLASEMPEEIGNEDDGSVVQTALRLLRRHRDGDTKH